MIAIHMHESSPEQNIRVLDDRPRRNTRQRPEFWVKRSWSTRINILCTEDSTGYGTQFGSVPPLNIRGVPTALAWSLMSILSSCPPLWHAVDALDPFVWSRWEGWLLTAIQHHCFSFQCVRTDKRSPFKKLPLGKVVGKVNSCIRDGDVEMTDEAEQTAEEHYKIGTSHFRMLFQRSAYHDSVLVLTSVEDATEEQLRRARVAIVVGNLPPLDESFRAHSYTLDLQAVCVLRSKEKGQDPSKYDAIRYMRHANHSKFWKQERGDCIATKCTNDLFDVLGNSFSETDYLYSVVSVYVVRGRDCLEKNWEKIFFESMGGKSHVMCKCRMCPFIPTNKAVKAKLNCNARVLTPTAASTDNNSTNTCERKEAFVCSNPLCSARLCRRCFDALPNNTTTVVKSPEHESAFLDHVDHESDQSEGELSVDDALSDGNDSDDDGHVPEALDDCNTSGCYTILTPQDPTLDVTPDNWNEHGFSSTHAGDLPIAVEQGLKGERVDGHVIFNQVGGCVSRHNGSISGTSRQKHWIQSLCSSVSGHSIPLMQPEAALFPRHFYIASTLDRRSTLGARPLACMTSSTYAYGIESALGHARQRMTDPTSSVGTDPSFVCSVFDELGNLEMNRHHSRDVYDKGFVVDSASRTGMTVRDTGSTGLSESVDSHKMVLNLARSQKYIDWSLFYTDTANQSERPGLHGLHSWLRSMAWSEELSKCHSMSHNDRVEVARAMDEAAGPHLYSLWNTTKRMFLHHLRHHRTAIGRSSAIFARDEYQGKAGNLSHVHLITANEKTSERDDTPDLFSRRPEGSEEEDLSSSEEKEFELRDMIRTSTLEIVHGPDDLSSLLEKGLIVSEDGVLEVTKRAETVLPHKCDERCLRRIGDGDGPENFRCRKLHPVKGSPDPTSHAYVSFDHDYMPTTLAVLEEIGIYHPPPEDSGPHVSGTFDHAFFSPTRHMAPCNHNAQCNMSPVILDFFVALKSMQNAQLLAHTNGVAKYVTKYIAKVDQGNYVMLCEDVHTGKWVLTKTHLHNTKIVSSNINEDKAFQKLRFKNHPRGREYSYFEMRQIIMGDAEVYTDLEFLSLPTVPFELRPTNSVKLDKSGDVVRPEFELDALQFPNAYEVGIPMMGARHIFGIPEEHHMTKNQAKIYRNHNGDTTRYCAISMFGLRPPELLGVFRNPVDYYRCCSIDDGEILKTEVVRTMICRDIRRCWWVDCLGRRVKIRRRAFGEVTAMAQKNISDLVSLDDCSRREFDISMNRMIIEMIESSSSSVAEEHNEAGVWNKETLSLFVDFSCSDRHLPIPVTTNSTPFNPHHFLTHVILSLGKYDTEIDALTHSSFRDSFRAAHLIGPSDDIDDLKQYSRRLTRLYVLEQVVYYPVSVSRAEAIIVAAKKVLDDAIIENQMSMSDLAPFTMSYLYSAREAENDHYWSAMKSSQLDYAYSSLRDASVPSREVVKRATRNSPVDWSPRDSLTQYQRQSSESFAEQQVAVSLIQRQIDRYRSAGSVCLKNPCVHGAPGAGKSFVGSVAVLYALSRGLNVISTALMALRAQAIGGTHLHEFFKLPTSDKSRTAPHVAANMALEKIRRKTHLLHALLTVDMIFLDEAGQVSSEQLATIDIILRKGRNSQTPFAGVLIVSTMDPHQLGPINAMPFLCSSLILTSFVMVELRHSVRAHGYPEFKRLQDITRMDPQQLRRSPELKAEFAELAESNLTFVASWEDDSIGPNMLRSYSRRMPAQEALDECRESIKRRLDTDRT